MLAAVLGFFASQNGGDGGGPLNVIAAAAEKTQSEPGGRALIRSTVTSPDQAEPLRLSGQAVFSDDNDRTQGVMKFRDPESGDPIEMEFVGEGTTVYFSSSLFGELPDGKKWMKLDLSFLEESETPLPENTDAKDELALLEAVSGDVQKLGREDVRGVPTTRYRGTVDNVERARQLRDKGAGDLAEQLENGSPLKIEVWIDDDGLVRRMRYAQSLSADRASENSTIKMRVEFYDFGIVPEVELPDSSEVFDFTSVAEEEAGIE